MRNLSILDIKASVRRIHHLVFLVRNSAGDASIMASYVMAGAEFPCALWEYIRRCMDQVGDKAMSPRGGKFDMIDALERAQKNYWRDWREAPWTQFWQHLCLPFFIPFLFVSPLLVWSARMVHWLPNLKEALGRPMTQEDLLRDTSHQIAGGWAGSGSERLGGTERVGVRGARVVKQELLEPVFRQFQVNNRLRPNFIRFEQLSN